MIYQTIDTVGQLRDAFLRANRSNQFSYDGLKALFDHLESMGEDLELDVIGLCCEYSEDDLETVLKDHGLDSFSELEQNTWAVMVGQDRVLYMNF